MFRSALVVALLCLSFATRSLAQTCPHEQQGLLKWSQWPQRPLTPLQNVTIPTAVKILIDVSPPLIHNLEILGQLVFAPNASIDLDAHNILVLQGGQLFIGTAACPIASGNHVGITLHGRKMTGVDPMGFGTKVLAAQGGCSIDIHGSFEGPAWTVLGTTATAGSTSLVLSQEVDWAVGKEIIIATTDFELFDEPLSFQTETRTISGRPNGNTVSFNQPLAYTHWGEIWTGSEGHQIDMRAEVGLLTRNIVIRGANTEGSEAAGWGGHIMVHYGAQLRIKGAELYHMGQSMELGRYPIHFHLAGVRDDSYVVDNSIHDTFQRCVTIHGTHQVLIKNNVAFNAKGHCFFVEDGAEEDNVFANNLGIQAIQHEILLSDVEPSVFWITNPKNHFYDNVAVGGKFGFWYAMPETPLGPSAGLSGFDSYLRNLPMGDFAGNKAHSTSSGLFVDRGQENDAGRVDELTPYDPRDFSSSIPFLPSPNYLDGKTYYERLVYGTAKPAVFMNFTAYKCADFGMWGRGSYLHTYGAKLADNSVGTSWPGEGNLFQSGVIVGETTNVGNLNVPLSAWWPSEEGRNRPVKYWIDKPLIGYQSYDAGFGDTVIDTTFYNFEDFTFSAPFGRTRKSGALGAQMGPNVLGPFNRFYRMHFVNVENNLYFYEYLPYYDEVANAIGYHAVEDVDDAMRGVVIVDTDGSITGTCGSSIVGVGAHLRHSGCTERPAWNAWVCPNDYHAHRALSILDADLYIEYGDIDLLRGPYEGYLHRLSDPAVVPIEPDLNQYQLGDSTLEGVRQIYGTNALVNQEYLFRVNRNITMPHIFISSTMKVGEFFVFAFPFPSGTTFTVTKPRDDNFILTAVNSKAELTTETYFFDPVEHLLWVRMQAHFENYDWRYSIPLLTTDAALEIQAACPGSNCLQPVDQLPAGPAPSGATMDNCEPIPVRAYTEQGTRYNLFVNGEWVNNWALFGDFGNCTINSGEQALICSMFSELSTNYFYSYKTVTGPIAALSSATHLVITMKTAPSFGPSRFAVILYGDDDNPLGDAVPLHSPSYTDSEIGDEQYSTIRIPIADVGLVSNAFKGFLVLLYDQRPVVVYLKEVFFATYDVTSQPNPGWPIAPPRPSLEGPGNPDSTSIGGTFTTPTGTTASTASSNTATSVGETNEESSASPLQAMVIPALLALLVVN